MKIYKTKVYANFDRSGNFDKCVVTGNFYSFSESVTKVEICEIGTY